MTFGGGSVGVVVASAARATSGMSGPKAALNANNLPISLLRASVAFGATWSMLLSCRATDMRQARLSFLKSIKSGLICFLIQGINVEAGSQSIPV